MSLEDEWNKAKPIDTFDARLIQEGIDPASHKGATLKAIYSQESSSGKNTNTSNAGAVGGMQIMPNTFNSVANKEWDINNPEHSTRAGIRYGSQLYDANSGDANKTAIGYYGGQNAINKAEQGIAVSDPRNPNAPNTIEYANSITNKMNNAEQDNLKKLWDSSSEIKSTAQENKPKSSMFGLGGRAMLEGVAGVPAGIYNAVSALGNIGMPENRPTTPLTPPESINTQQYGTKLADYLGLPQPTNEQAIPMEVARTISGFAVPLGMLSKIKSIPSMAATMIGSNAPKATAITAGLSKYATEKAKEKGLPEWEQSLFGMLTGLGAGSVLGMAAPTSRAVLRTGQSSFGTLEPLAGRLLNRQAGAEAGTVANLLEKGEIPGVKPFGTGQYNAQGEYIGQSPLAFKPKTSDIAGNAGISALARFVENDPNSSTILSERLFNNAKSLKDYVNRTIGSDASITKKQDYLYDVVNTVSKPMRDRNLPTNIDNVTNSIDNALLKNKGNPAIEGALQSIKEKIPQGDVGFNEVYNFKQYIDDALRGKYDDPASMQIAKSGTALNNVKTELAKSLTNTESEFGKFLKTQAIGVRQLNQSKQAEKMINQATNKTPIISNRTGIQEEVFPLSAANLRTQILNEKAMSKLSPNQQAIFENAQRAATSGTRGSMGMARGSNTMQNLKMNELISDDVTRALLGSDVKDQPGILSNILRPVTRGLSNVTGRTGEIADILAKAELDPAYAAMLMRKYKLSPATDMKSAAGRNALYGALTQYQNK
jgi:hypothetical protein